MLKSKTNSLTYRAYGEKGKIMEERLSDGRKYYLLDTARDSHGRLYGLWEDCILGDETTAKVTRLNNDTRLKIVGETFDSLPEWLQVNGLL